MRRRTRIALNSALAAALVATGVGTWLVLSPGQATAGEEDGTTARTAAAALGEASVTIAAQGTVEPVATHEVSFAVGGAVTAVNVQVGSTVETGTVLATVDTSVVDADVAAATADVDTAQRALDTARLQLTSATQGLTEAQTAYAEAQASSATSTRGSSSAGSAGSAAGGSSSRSGTQSAVTSAKAQVSSAQSEVTQAQTRLADAQAVLAEAQAAVADTTLVSPVAGVVTGVGGAVGDTITGSSGSGSSAAAGSSGSGGTSAAASSAFVTVADTSALRVSATFDEADAAQLAVGQAATVTFPAVDGASAAASVTAIDPVGAATNGVVTYGATITLTEVPASVRLGQTASVVVVTESAQDVLVVPSQAVEVQAAGQPTGGEAEASVWGTVTVQGDDGARESVRVEIGVQGDSTTEIRSGLEEGDVVVISLDTEVGTTTTTQDQVVPGTGGGFQGPPGGGFGGGGSGGGGFGGGQGAPGGSRGAS